MTDEHVCVSVCVLVLRSHSHAQRSTTEFILLVSSAPAMWPLAISTVVTCPVSDLSTVSPPGCCDRTPTYVLRLFLFIFLTISVRPVISTVPVRHPQGPPSPGAAIPRVRHPQGPPSPGSAIPRVRYPQGPPSPGSATPGSPSFCAYDPM